MQTKSELYKEARQLILDATGVLNVIKSKDMDTVMFMILDHLDKATHLCKLGANEAKIHEISAENEDA